MAKGQLMPLREVLSRRDRMWEVEHKKGSEN